MLNVIKEYSKKRKTKAREKKLKDKRFKRLDIIDVIKSIAEANLSRYGTDAMVYREIATFLLNSGQPELAKEFFELSLKESCDRITYSLYLQCLLLTPSCTDKQMYKAARKYKKFLSDVENYKKYSLDLNPDKKLNIAYVSNHFHGCISKSLLVPFIRAHDRQKVKVFCYSDTHDGEVDNNIKTCADVWRDTIDLNDNELAELIHQDQIDILLELNGHVGNNRYGVVTQKPAPIQISYYNFSATTGVSGFDYILAGDETDFSKSKKYFTEEIYSLKGTKNAVQFGPDFPDCGPAPFLENGYITFGSFGEAHKVNAEVIKLWCEVLRKVPNSKFYMKASVLRHDNFINAYKKLFADENIDPARIYLEGPSEHKQMLACYSKVDVALDTFPHGGGATTMEALWQGVPVLSIYGDRFASQYGKMILSCVGHPELVAYSHEEFVNKAASLAEDKPRLAYYRQQLREDFRNSSRADVPGFAAKLETAYRDMWHRYTGAHLRST